MYAASLGTPDRNSHLHIHVCPCPPGLPIEKQELAAMEKPNGEYLAIDDDRMYEIAQKIKAHLNLKREL
jgi:histidine triad (HIT) family protein